MFDTATNRNIVYKTSIITEVNLTSVADLQNREILFLKNIDDASNIAIKSTISLNTVDEL